MMSSRGERKKENSRYKLGHDDAHRKQELTTSRHSIYVRIEAKNEYEKKSLYVRFEADSSNSSGTYTYTYIYVYNIHRQWRRWIFVLARRIWPVCTFTCRFLLHFRIDTSASHLQKPRGEPCGAIYAAWFYTRSIFTL